MSELKLGDLYKGIDVKSKKNWGDYPDFAWEKHSKAVVAQSEGQHGGCVLFTAGPHVALMMEDCGCQLGDIGLDDAPEGISIFEGRTFGGQYQPHSGDYDDIYLKGTYRPPTEQEWEAIRDGRCPWEDAEWRSL